MFELNDKVAVITGSTRGIGLAVAKAMVRHGAKVAISSRKQAACNAVAEEINSEHPARAFPIAASISSKSEIENLISGTVRQFGGVDILVCNAASNPFYGSQLEIPDDAFRKTLENNIMSTNWLIKEAAPHMKAKGSGSVLIVSSAGGLAGTAVLGAYTITKAADFQLARNIAMELGPYGITVNCISPGLIKTDFSKALWENPETLAETTALTPLRRIGSPEDIAGAAVFLSSAAGRFVTGHNLVVDGGVTSSSRLD
jgi:NAD(P)-dependent dehydrogenase (short-subunit alcohol dehydrogenase family)